MIIYVDTGTIQIHLMLFTWDFEQLWRVSTEIIWVKKGSTSVLEKLAS